MVCKVDKKEYEERVKTIRKVITQFEELCVRKCDELYASVTRVSDSYYADGRIGNTKFKLYSDPTTVKIEWGETKLKISGSEDPEIFDILRNKIKATVERLQKCIVNYNKEVKEDIIKKYFHE